LAPVKTCVEASNLRHVGEPFGDRFNRRQIVRLVQRGKRHQAIKFRQDLGCHNRWVTVPRAAMYDTMADAKQLRIAVLGSEPRSQCLECIEAVPHFVVELLIDEDSAPGIPCRNMR
jgi:hypothetical protein